MDFDPRELDDQAALQDARDATDPGSDCLICGEPTVLVAGVPNHRPGSQYHDNQLAESLLEDDPFHHQVAALLGQPYPAWEDHWDTNEEREER